MQCQSFHSTQENIFSDFTAKTCNEQTSNHPEDTYWGSRAITIESRDQNVWGRYSFDNIFSESRNCSRMQIFVNFLSQSTSKLCMKQNDRTNQKTRLELI